MFFKNSKRSQDKIGAERKQIWMIIIYFIVISENNLRKREGTKTVHGIVWGPKRLRLYR